MKLFAGVALALSILVGPAHAQAPASSPIVIKFSHVVATDAPKGKMADKFKQLAEERTKGRVRIEVYANSTLYKDKEEVEALQLGAVQMLAPSLAKFGPLGVKEFEVFDLPYVFPDEAAFHRVADGPIGKALLAKLDGKGIEGLGYIDNGFHAMAGNKPMRKPADFKGMKMRIQSSKVLEAQMRALGAIPQVMAASEVYQAMQTGVVDGTEGVPSGIYTQKLNEVAKYMTLSDHGHLAYAVIANKAFWDGLPADIRTTLEGALKDAIDYGNAAAKKDNADAVVAIRATGKTEITVLTPQQKEEWRQVLLPVHKEVEGRIGKGLIEQVYRTTGFGGAK
ncbi:MAG: DctP family TRAP transporter solute-binding subunit [Burkholderiaceae bacterium]